MQKVIFFIGFMFVFLSTNFFAQNKTDSLLKLIKTTKHDTVKVSCYNSLFLQLEFEDDVNKGKVVDALDVRKPGEYESEHLENTLTRLSKNNNF